MLWLYQAAHKLKHSVVRVNGADAKLQRAAKVARTMLPQFLARLKNPSKGDQFAIKGRFQTSAGSEYLWVRAPKPVRDGFTGELDQPPIALRAKKGDRVKVRTGDVYDWLVRRKDGSMAGGFTEIALGAAPR